VVFYVMEKAIKKEINDMINYSKEYGEK